MSELQTCILKDTSISSAHVSLRRLESANLASEELCESDRRGIFPKRTHNLHSDGQSALAMPHGGHGRRTSCQGRHRDPSNQVVVLARAGRGRDGALACGFAMVVRKRRCKRDWREENVYFIKVLLPLLPEAQPLEVLALPLREASEARGSFPG